MNIILNFAISADGKISSSLTTPSRFSSDEDLDRLLRIRLRADAILVGRGTLEADHMSMTIPASYKPARQPLRCVASRRGQFDLSHRIFQTPGGAIHLLVTQPPAHYDPKPYEQAGATVHQCSLSDFLKHLSQQQSVSTLLCEGGGALAKTLFELDLVDEINLTWAGHTLIGGQKAPTIQGLPSEHLPQSRHYQPTSTEVNASGEIFLTYHRI